MGNLQGTPRGGGGGGEGNIRQKNTIIGDKYYLHKRSTQKTFHTKESTHGLILDVKVKFDFRLKFFNLVGWFSMSFVSQG